MSNIPAISLDPTVPWKRIVIFDFRCMKLDVFAPIQKLTYLAGVEYLIPRERLPIEPQQMLCIPTASAISRYLVIILDHAHIATLDTRVEALSFL